MNEKTNYSNTIMEVLGIENVEITKDKLVLSMPVGPKTHQPMGLLHGGASVVLAETAASIGTWINIDSEKYAPVGLEINANHIRGKKSGTVYATATPLHKGRKTFVWDIQITDEQEKLICISRCTVAVIEKQ
ncbi:hotdog fold thioesterase [Bacillus tianshenii]|nr:hotdog fold thioesterase [Bacillus tianshenii]